MSPNLLSGAARLAGTSLLRLQSDERLAEMAQAGHDPAFGALVDRYRADLLRYCERVVGPSRAEDVLQQALLNAHLAMSSLSENSNVRAWLYRIAHNVAVNVLRAAPAVATLDDRAAAPDAIHENLEVRERLRAALDAISRLPQPQRDALTLRAIEGRSHHEIADALGVTPGAARQQIHRARATVRAAVSAITPYGLLVRFAMAGGGTPLPAPELAAGAGAGAGVTVAKVAAGLLAAGALAGGATNLPAPGLLHHHRHHAAEARAAEAGSGPEAASATTPLGPNGVTAGDDHGSRSGSSDDGRGRGRGRGGSDRRGDEHSSSLFGTPVSGDGRGSDDVSEHFGSGESHSGSSGGGGSDDHSGSGDSGSSGSGSHDGGGDDHSGSGDSGSSTSGSSGGDSGSGSDDGSGSLLDLATSNSGSGSGDSGSGSTSGSDGGSSGSGDSGSSGGSGSSGSDDSATTSNIVSSSGSGSDGGSSSSGSDSSGHSG